MVRTRLVFLLSLSTLLANEAMGFGDPILFLSDEASNSLYRVDPSSGSTSYVGGFGSPTTMVALAYDSQQDILFGMGYPTGTTGRIFSIDRNTGRASQAGDTGLVSIHGLAYDPNTGFLYTTYYFPGYPQSILYQIDPHTAQATRIGALGMFGTIFGLGFDPITNNLYGCSYAATGTTNPFFQIDVTTGEATKLFDTPNLEAIAFDRKTGQAYGLDNAGGLLGRNALDTIDLTTGQVSLVSYLPEIQNGLGLAFVEPVPIPSTALLLCAACVFIFLGRNYLNNFQPGTHGNRNTLWSSFRW